MVDIQTFSGTHHEIGVQQGRANYELFRKALEQLPNFEVVKRMKPRLLPFPLFWAIAKRRSAKLLENDMFEYYPRQAQRLKGIAEGAGVDMQTALFAQAMELSVTVGESSYRLPGCTSLGFSLQRTRARETIIAKNFDYPNDFAVFQLTCLTRPEEGYQTLGCTMATQPGMIDGMNEHGLTVTYNLGYTTDKPKYFVPISMMLQEMLETCRNTDESIEFITHAKRAGGALLLLADSEDNVKAMEISPNYAATREATDNQIVNTNHYHTPDMQSLEVPRNAIFTSKIVKDRVGVRVHESSEQRLTRAQELLRDQAKIDENKIAAILSDHGKDNKPSNLTICQHGNFISTLRSVIFYPKRKMIKVLYGNPCQNKYSEFTF